MQASSSSLAVVVIGRNEGERLVACLKSVRASSNLPESTELIYVDSNSTDGSPERAEALGAKVIVLGAGKLSAARARNAGWRSATAQLILFLDGDTILHRDFIGEAMKPFAEDPSIAVVWGHRREIRPEASVYNRILDLDWIYAPGFTEFCGGDALMRRSSLEKAGGFNPDLIAGEEPDLCRRMRAAGDRILHIDVPMTGHDIAMFHFQQYWRRAVRTGHAYAEIKDRYRNTADPFWSKESTGNIVRGSVFLLGAILACAASIVAGSPLPLLLALAAFALLAVRTAAKSAWKGASWSTLLLFGAHSHFQQIPVLQGQLLYFWGRWRNKNSELIEYKNGTK
jgi:glycosyltransferase involved in cell wall biosynthesis